MTSHYQALIVGGGPAGLAAAEAAARRGVRTLVVEREPEIGSPIHTSGGSWIEDMQALSIPQSLYHPTPHVIFLSPHKEVRLHYEPALACILDVRGVYQHLARRAASAGASIRVAHTVDQVLRENGRVVGVTVKNALGERIDIRADLVIDASGVARYVGVRADASKAFRRYGFGAEYDLYAPHYPQDEVFLMMGNAFAPSGYAWAFPRGNGRVRLGVGVIHPDSKKVDARDYLDKIMCDVPQLAGLLKGASPVEYHTGLFPAERALKRFSHDGLLLAGDAGGHGSTLVGEGIRFAIYSGQMAGEIAASAILAGNTSAMFLSRFDRRWRARFGRNMDIAYMINRTIASYSDDQWDRAFRLFEQFTPAQTAQAIRGDFSVGLVLGILMHNPAVLATGGKLLLDRLMKHPNTARGKDHLPRN